MGRRTLLEKRLPLRRTRNRTRQRITLNNHWKVVYNGRHDIQPEQLRQHDPATTCRHPRTRYRTRRRRHKLTQTTSESCAQRRGQHSKDCTTSGSHPTHHLLLARRIRKPPSGGPGGFRATTKGSGCLECSTHWQLSQFNKSIGSTGIW